MEQDYQTTVRAGDADSTIEGLATADSALKYDIFKKIKSSHGRIPWVKKIPLPAIGIIVLVAAVNIIVWIAVGILLRFHTGLISTAGLSYTLGLRHALDADHISAIDLMTRRLVASGRRPVTVGTFFSLGHSTIVIITSIVVAATASTFSSKFDSFGTIGGIIGSSVSAAFLILLGLMNVYILYKLIMQMRKVLNLREDEIDQGWQVEGGGCLFHVLKKMFKLINRPWKMYPLGVLFGLGFDTSSEIALLGISSIQAAQGTSIWLILIFPVLFTAGMCLIDTIDGAMMLTLYVLPAENFLDEGPTQPLIESVSAQGRTVVVAQRSRGRDPIAFLYYSIVLTSLTVIVALVIGTIQLLTMILNVAEPSGAFWRGVDTAGDYYEVIGGSICASFVVIGGLSVLLYKPWRRRAERGRPRLTLGTSDLEDPEAFGTDVVQDTITPNAETPLQPNKQDAEDQCYDNLRVSKNAFDTNIVKANPEYIAVNWDASGGGAFAVLPLNEKGRLPDLIPLFRGHTATVLDTDWNPFNDSLIASGGYDGKILLWRVPDGFTLYTDDPEDIKDVSPVGKLSGHPKQVGHVLFNPAAENVLASASGDFTIKLWDLEAGSAKLSLKVGDAIQSLTWSANGALLATTSRDKKFRIWDVRQQRPAQEVQGHAGAKNSRAVWMGEHDRVATTGFSRMSDRQLALWDIKAPREPIGGFQMLDSMSGVCMPFWDDGTQCLYLAGKGDGNIRYYEYENDKLEYLSEYKSADPQRGIAFMPKRGVNMHDNEVMRAYKTVNDNYIEPISFIVPRRSETFQEDIYPPTVGLKPAVSSGEWFDGKDGIPPKVDMETLYEGKGLKEVTGAQVTTKTPEPRKMEAPAKKADVKEPEPVPTPTSLKSPPSMKEQGSSMAAMVDKFADNEGNQEEESDASSFEEVSKPVEKKAEVKPFAPPPTKTEEEPKPQPSPVSASGLWNAAPGSKAPGPSLLDKPAETVKPAGPVSPVQESVPPLTSSTDVEREIRDMKTVMAQQSRQITAQGQTLADLMAEINTLKSKLENV